MSKTSEERDVDDLRQLTAVESHRHCDAADLPPRAPVHAEPVPWTPLTRAQCLQLALALHRQRRAERVMGSFV